MSKKKWSEWTDIEISILKEYYPKGGIKLCKEKGLNRDGNSIKIKASSLSIPYNHSVWSEEEVAILKEYFPVGGYNLCKEKGITKSIQSIRSKAYSLSLYYNALSWSDEEIAILRKYYSEGSYILCQEKGLKRSKASIKHKAVVLGIKTNKKWSEENIKILKEYYPKGGYILCQEKGLNKSKDLIKYKAMVLGLNVEGVLWSDDEISLLNKYYPIGGSKLCQEKGINRTEGAIRRKAVMYFPEHIRNKLYSRNNHPNKWLTSELDILKKYYPEGGVKLCQENGLNRTSGAISSKAHSINIKVINKEGVIELKDNTWSDDELKLLKDYYLKEGVELCIEKGLDRKISAISSKAQLMGLKAPNNSTDRRWQGWELDILEKYYPLEGAKFCKDKGINRNINSIITKANRLGLKVVYLKDRGKLDEEVK